MEPRRSPGEAEGRAARRLARTPSCSLVSLAASWSARELAQVVPRIKPGVVAVVEHDPDRIIADRLDADEGDILLAGHDPLLARRMALNLGARALHPQSLGGQAGDPAVVEDDLQDPSLLAHGDVGRPRHGPVSP